MNIKLLTLFTALFFSCASAFSASLNTYSGSFKMNPININSDDNYLSNLSEEEIKNAYSSYFGKETKAYLKGESGYYRHNSKVEGKATYTYKDAKDGTRIFHGNFTFDSDDFSVSGKFADNHQVGTWVYKFAGNTDNDNYSFDKEKGTAIITFNNNGEVEGPASYYVDETNHYEFSIKDGMIDGAINIVYGPTVCTLKKGLFIGKYTYKNTNKHDNRSDEYRLLGIHTEGMFNNDGKPVGKWIQKKEINDYSDKKIIEPIIQFSDEGELLKSYYVDESTGDKIEYNFFTPKLYKFVPGLFRNYWMLLMRDSIDINLSAEN